jgi:methylated-DNA-[protein]-cysteine S-methyltransferase
MPTPDRSSWFCLGIATEVGEFLASYSESGLAGLRFPSDRRAATPDTATAISPQIHQWHRVTTDAVKQILAGLPPKHLPPLDLSGGTEFQRDVWRAMTKIQFSQTRSYGEIANAIGNPKAVRAVGGACGANPIPVLVPCHRVLAANKKIGGFSSGLDWKRTLLAREGVSVAE